MGHLHSGGSQGTVLLEQRLEVASLVQLLHVRVAADGLAAHEHVGHGALARDLLERVLLLAAAGDLVQFHDLVLGAQLREQRLGLGTVRAVALAVHHNGRRGDLGLHGLLGAHHLAVLVVFGLVGLEANLKLSLRGRWLRLTIDQSERRKMVTLQWTERIASAPLTCEPGRTWASSPRTEDVLEWSRLEVEQCKSAVY
ncbi:hypothetical protein ON010_g16762 [Phytophthora cinnamomi]|nr:hypothetical protein ON010_g16762 [Phytophthora cinnamomi]